MINILILQKSGQCNCLFGFGGKRCGRKMTLNALRYNGSSYSPYESNVLMATSAQLTLSARLENESGILYYSSQYDNGTGNYFLVEFISGVIQLSFTDDDGKPATVRYITIAAVALVTSCVCGLECIKHLHVLPYM